ncbi:hypothetical protein [Spirosoma pollinicola]|uniref:Uncharacterized protein n=1 Tax=Spirosoma pollinicola TaxID=2057025 RepID=A0A2K8Z6G9_9BACT|nr:hypothetical protein [Spirosoma pollinicola]AUD05460.1 hypothetical protein CWM47_28610 [Spirosoma pollinicola]
MNPVTFTTRPLLSTVKISANVHYNSRTLDELLVSSQETRLHRISSLVKSSSTWRSHGSYLGLDESNHLMYGLTRRESWMFSAVSFTGLIVLGTLVNWLCL